MGLGSLPGGRTKINGVCSSEAERWFVEPEAGISKLLMHPT